VSSNIVKIPRNYDSQTWDRAGIDFPVNLLMCFEGMEEYGSDGLDEVIREEAGKWFKDAEAVCISDN
jgi:Cys-Gly metallodipeptidase DUG1